jgi:glucokinase
MSGVSLKLVQNRPFAASSDDLAAVLMFSAVGLIGQFFALAVGINGLIA